MGGQPGCQPRAFLFINKTSRGQKLTFDFNHGFKSIISGTRWLSSSSLVPGLPGGWGEARGGQTVMSGCRGREVSAKGGADKTHFCWRIGSLLVTAPCSVLCWYLMWYQMRIMTLLQLGIYLNIWPQHDCANGKTQYTTSLELLNGGDLLSGN